MLLIFIDDADDAACYPLSRLLGMTVAANATLKVKFGSSLVSGGLGLEHDEVEITITADKEKEVMQDIGAAIQSAKKRGEGSVVICDDVGSEYVSRYITSCAITLDT